MVTHDTTGATTPRERTRESMLRVGFAVIYVDLGEDRPPVVLNERETRILALLVGEAADRQTDPRMAAERRDLYERLCSSIGA